MKKWAEAALFRLGYVPISQVHAAVEAGAAEMESLKAAHASWDCARCARRDADALAAFERRELGRKLAVMATQHRPVVKR